MIENVAANNDSLIINNGEGYTPSQPPSTSTTTTTTQKSDSGPAVQVELSKEVSDTVAAKATISSSSTTASSSTVKSSTKTSNEIKTDDKNEKEMDQKLKDTIQALNDKLSRLDHEVQFKVDKRINKNYISVIDKKTKEVIREFPPEEVRAFIARFDEFNQKILGTSDVKSLIVNLEV